ncbi:hypothetical protein C6Q28_16185 [Burkholderia multivorans]|uniref:Uncharacterized protein n=1 Tax=Burkholderia multivorans (strain ATCC 17616 / 249) TaxID=395019 RepID=A0A0H3KGG6_BURM1|nr:hypothetical protein C6Q28_16185 [Burkholderia multivorans]BAG42305.1 hypothetical protein BMULJ_00332 [Burkholderia multivorans ATCC 17616]
MTATLRNGDTAPSFRPATWPGPPRGASVQSRRAPAHGAPSVVRAHSIQYNTRPAISNRQVNRYPETQRGQQTMITFT